MLECEFIMKATLGHRHSTQLKEVLTALLLMGFESGQLLSWSDSCLIIFLHIHIFRDGHIIVCQS